MIPRSFINNLLDRIDIVEVISPRVRLKKAGSNYQGLCPFHNEKSPSFSVSPIKQFFYCFGCGVHGNAIDFLMQFNKLTFPEAIDSLASLAGVEVPREEQTPAEKELYASRINLYEILNRITKFYQHSLGKCEHAQQYVAKRGLNKDVCARYAIGYAPAARGSLQKALRGGGSLEKQLVETGMLLTNERNETYERFRDRLMFPIRDRKGRVVAFGGRNFSGEQPKYLNSPETTLFHKGEEIYGLYEARQALRQIDQLIVVEGYMDVVALAEFGVANAVATMGTAITVNQVKKLLRETTNIIFCFDGDGAGRKAAWRALEIILPLMHEGLTVGFVFLPEKDDPDSYVRRVGKDGFLDLVAKAEPLSEYFFDYLANHPQANMCTLDGRAFMAKIANSSIAKMPGGVFKELMMLKLADLVKMDNAKLKKLMENDGKNELKNRAALELPESNQNVKLPKLVQSMLGLLLHYPKLAENISADEIKIAEKYQAAHLELLLDLINLAKKTPKLSFGAIIEYYRDTINEPLLVKLAAREFLLPYDDALSQEFLDSWHKLMSQFKEQSLDLLLQKAAQDSLSLSEKQQLQDLLRDLKNS